LIGGGEPIDGKRIVIVAALDPRLEGLWPERPRWLANERKRRLDRRDGVDCCRQGDSRAG
jgi:hypothetical protein